jgi:galactosyl transferase GMA12/MNN10 family.
LENDEKFEKKAVFIDQSLINSYPDDRCGAAYKKGDFIVHWAGNQCGIMEWTNEIDYSINLWNKNPKPFDYIKQEWRKSYFS